MAQASQDSDRAAAIGNTQALKDVLVRIVGNAAEERTTSAPETVDNVDAQTYSVVLGSLVMELIDNERTNATQRGYRLAEENEAALASAVQQIRSA